LEEKLLLQRNMMYSRGRSGGRSECIGEKETGADGKSTKEKKYLAGLNVLKGC
jgi:hypothetical protein